MSVDHAADAADSGIKCVADAVYSEVGLGGEDDGRVVIGDAVPERRRADGVVVSKTGFGNI